MNKYLLITLLITFFSCTSNQNEKMDRIKDKIEELENRTEINETQMLRKSKSEKFLVLNKIKVNSNLPYIENEEQTNLRPPKEVAQRVSVLAAVNHVAFGNFSGEEITNYLKRYNLWEFTTENEKLFLKNPTEETKNNESWKVEGIWTLLWSLNAVDDLELPDKLADLNKVSTEQYPFLGLDEDPNKFISKMTKLRSKADILDASDLYYRIDWACVDARVNGKVMEVVNSSVVYERHYALNWLVNYMDQEWDDITCDT